MKFDTADARRRVWLRRERSQSRSSSIIRAVGRSVARKLLDYTLVD